MRAHIGLNFQSICKMNLSRSYASSLFLIAPFHNVHNKQLLTNLSLQNGIPTSDVIIRRQYMCYPLKSTSISSVSMQTSYHPFVDSTKRLLLKNCQHLVHNFECRCLSAVTRNDQSPQRPKKPSKSATKNFTINGKIHDHDLNVKFMKIKNLLSKGKAVDVILTQKATMPVNVNEFEQKLKDSVGSLAKVHQQFSTESKTKFSLTPVIKKDAEELDEDEDVTQ